MIGYKTVGASATHLAIFILRAACNILAVVLLLTYPEVLTYEFVLSIVVIKTFLLTTCLTASLYFYEMMNNIFSVINNKDVRCGDRSVLCKIYKDPIFCDF
jgi:hypothetical protein